MLELVNPDDASAVRNKDSVLAVHDLMIDQGKTQEAATKYLSPSYIQHNPLIPDGADALAGFFGQVVAERARPRVEVHRIVAVGDWVWTQERSRG